MKHRGGTALVVVLFVVALTSALVVGGAYAGRSMAASARFSRTGSSMESPAARALVRLVARWDTAARNAQAPGAEVAAPLEVIDGVGVTGWITRLSGGTWWLVVETADHDDPGFDRRIGLLVHDSAGVVSADRGPAWAQLP